MHDILNSGKGTDTCGRCGKAKEPTRLNSNLCRTCDGRAARKPRVPTKRLTVDLPAEVWDRLNAEAAAKGQKIGLFAKGLIITRDEKVQQKKAAKDQ